MPKTATSSREGSSGAHASMPSSGPVNQRAIAAQYLGHGYVRTGRPGEGRLLHQTLQDFSQLLSESVNVLYTETMSSTVYSSNAKRAEHELKRSFNAQTKASAQISHVVFSSQGDLDFDQINSTKLNQMKIVCAVSCIRSVKCTLSSIPPLKEGFSYSDPSIGPNFVKSVWLYTGFTIYLAISIDASDMSRTKSSKGGGGITFGQTASSTPSDTSSSASDTSSSASDTSSSSSDTGSSSLGISASLSAGSFQAVLANRSFTHVKIHSTVYGNFTLPHIARPTNLQELEQRIAEVFESFNSKVNGITSPKFLVDEQDLGSYTRDVPHVRSIPDECIPPSFVPPIELPPLSVDIDFRSLAEKILRGDTENCNQFNGERFSVETFLHSLQKIFGPLVGKGRLERNHVVSYTGVAGPSRIGKSFFIGFLLGEPIIMQEVEGGCGIRFDFAEAKETTPKVGHDIAQTKGCAVHGRCIDTAGFMYDTHGIEDALCNAWGVKLGFDVLRPDRLILMLPPEILLLSGRGMFIAILDRLRSAVSSLSHPNVLRSILFLFNEHLLDKEAPQRFTEVQIRQYIRQIVFSQTKERNRHLSDQYLVSQEADLTDEAIYEIIVQLYKQNPDLAKTIQNYQERIEILRCLLDGLPTNNILIAEFRNEDTRRQVEEWENREKLEKARLDKIGEKIQLSHSFHMENIVNNGSVHFHKVLTRLTAYFNNLFGDRQKLKISTVEHHNTIRVTERRLHELSRTRTKDPATLADLIEKANEEKKELEEDLKTEKKELKRIKRTISDLKISTATSTTSTSRGRKLRDDKSVYFKTLSPQPAIEPRSIVGAKWWAKQYLFKHHGNVPISKVKLDPKSGTFEKDDQSRLREGIYEGSFLPGWFGHTEDCSASVKLKVLRKDHPATQVRVNSDNEELRRQKDLRRESQDSIEVYKNNIRSCERTITQQEKEQDVLREREQCTQTILKLRSELDQIRIRLQAINAESATYFEYCVLVSRIIAQLHFDQSENPDERKIYTDFLNHIANESATRSMPSSSSS